jgi:hypothetical protein
METTILESGKNQPRRLRAIIEIDNSELRIFPLCDSDADERRILDALRFVAGERS